MADATLRVQIGRTGASGGAKSSSGGAASSARELQGINRLLSRQVEQTTNLIRLTSSYREEQRLVASTAQASLGAISKAAESTSKATERGFTLQQHQSRNLIQLTAKQIRATRELGKSQRNLGTTAVRSASRAERAWKKAASVISSSLSAASRAGGSALRGAGNRARSFSLRGLGGGGGSLLGGLIRGGAQVVSTGVEIGGQLVGGLLKGAGQFAALPAKLIGSLASSVPGVVTQGIGIAGKLAGGLISGIGNAAGSIAGALGDVVGAGGRLLGEIGGKLGDVFAGALTKTALAGITLLIASASQASAYQPLRQSFEGLSQSLKDSSGATVSATEQLDRYRNASKGLVSDLTLVKGANQAILLGAVDTVDGYEKLIEAGRRLGKATGRTAAEGIEDLSQGLGRQSRQILDNLGIVVNVTAAHQTYAESIGKSITELSDAEKRAGFLAAAYKGIEERLEKLGPEQESFGDQWNRLKATLRNLLITIGGPLIDTFGDLVGMLDRGAQGLAEFIKEHRPEIVEALGGAVRKVVSTVQTLAGVVKRVGLKGLFEGARSAANALWNGLVSDGKTAFDALEATGRAAYIRIKQFLKDALHEYVDIVGRVAAFFSGNGAAAVNGLPQGPGREDARAGAINEAQRLEALAADLTSKIGSGTTQALGGIVETIKREFRTGAGPRNRESEGIAIVAKQLRESGADAAKAIKEAAESARSTGAAAAFPKPTKAKLTNRDTSGGAGAGSAALSLQSAVDAAATLNEQQAAAFRGLIASFEATFGPIAPKAKEVGDLIIKKLSEAAKSAKKSERLQGRLEKERDRSIIRGVQREIEARDKARKEELKVAKEQERNAKRLRDKLIDIGKKLDETLDQIDETFEASRKAAEEASQRAISQGVDQIGRNTGQAGLAIAGVDFDRAGGGEGLPRNVRLAIERLQREAVKDRKESLKRLTSGLSSGDLARNDGELLREVLARQAVREEDPFAQVADLLRQQQQALEEQRFEREDARDKAIAEAQEAAAKATKEAITEGKEAAQELSERAAELLDETAAEAKAQNDAIREAANQIAKLKKEAEKSKREVEELRRILASIG